MSNDLSESLAESTSPEELGREQEYVSMLYGRLDQLREEMSERLAGTLLARTGGTRQAMGERDAAATRYTDQVARYTAVENGLCFGRLDLEDGDRRYVGRIGLFDETDEYRPLLVDWRAPAARSFYVATAASPDGVRRRRHIRTVRRAVVGLDDEILDLTVADPNRREGVTGEAALLAALNAGRTGQMQDIVETIQAEQDRVIRSGMNGVLVVQGGPGTGKTAVALHRAAYLLYTYREVLASRAVLVVGPNETFLRYIGQVLPSLGETSVVLSTVGDLYPGIRARRAEPPTTAEIKGRIAMTEILAAAVADRQRVPDEDLEIRHDDEVIRLSREACAAARRVARRTALPHNQAREVFVSEIVEALARKLAERVNENILVEEIVEELDRVLANDPLAEADGHDLFDEADLAEIRRELLASGAVRSALDELWPVLTPRRLLSELYSARERIATAAPGLTERERESLLRAPGGGWTPADVPLLDEAAELLGPPPRQMVDRAAVDDGERAEYARGVLEIMYGSRSLDDEEDPEMLMAQDLMDAGRLAARQEVSDDRTVAERAAADRRWAYGHVIVDEAQELSEMAWRVLMRRCPTRSMTLVGDIAQTGDLAGASSWQRVLEPYLDHRWRLEPLTVNYRMPAEIMAVAQDVLTALELPIEPPTSVRSTGEPPWGLAVSPEHLPGALAAAVEREIARVGGEGRIAVICPTARIGELTGALIAAPAAAGDEEVVDLDRPVVVLGVRQAKGLEFDAVLVVEPAEMISESRRGLNDLYVALTRATQRLGVVYSGALPDVLSGLAQRDPLQGLGRDR